MTVAEVSDAQVQKKSSKLPLILGVVLMLCGAAGGFFVVSSDLLNGEESHPPQVDVGMMPQVSFMPIDPIVVSFVDQTGPRHLRFRAELDLQVGAEEAVQAVMPRIVDVLNGYLRAMDKAILNEPSALITLRAQMLRRVQIITGKDAVRDLLIMEFVLD